MVRLASAGTDTNGIGPCDLVVIATKAFDVEAAAQSSVTLLGPGTVVQTIQNGLGSPEVAAPILGFQAQNREIFGIYVDQLFSPV
jgi:2-dehydropantoate 2-reductase